MVGLKDLEHKTGKTVVEVILGLEIFVWGKGWRLEKQRKGGEFAILK